MVVAGDVGLWTHRSQRPTRKTSRRGRRRRRGAGSRESFRFRWAQALRVVGACTALSLSSHRATSNQQSDQTIKPKAKPNQYTITTFFITIPHPQTIKQVVITAELEKNSKTFQEQVESYSCTALAFTRWIQVSTDNATLCRCRGRASVARDIIRLGLPPDTPCWWWFRRDPASPAPRRRVARGRAVRRRAPCFAGAHRASRPGPHAHRLPLPLFRHDPPDTRTCTYAVPYALTRQGQK
jgi:hypothetical protein